MSAGAPISAVAMLVLLIAAGFLALYWGARVVRRGWRDGSRDGRPQQGPERERPRG